MDCSDPMTARDQATQIGALLALQHAVIALMRACDKPERVDHMLSAAADMTLSVVFDLLKTAPLTVERSTCLQLAYSDTLNTLRQALPR